jgi:hypothetical protein
MAEPFFREVSEFSDLRVVLYLEWVCHSLLSDPDRRIYRLGERVLLS